MSIDIVPDGQTIDPVKIAYEKLVEVMLFLREKGFEDQEEEIANVLDQLGGYCCPAAMLDSKYPNDEHHKKDINWRKKTGIPQ